MQYVSITEAQKQLGISYPTLKQRLTRLNIRVHRNRIDKRERLIRKDDLALLVARTVEESHEEENQL